jgi:hypothetical protein
LPKRDSNRTMDDYGQPGRMRELMHRTRSQSLSNLQAAALAPTTPKRRKMPVRGQNYTVDNTGRPNQAPMRGMLQRTKSRSLTDLFSGMRKENVPISRPSAFGHMHRQNSRQRLLIIDDNEIEENELYNKDPKPIKAEGKTLKKKTKKTPNRQESEPSGLVNKKKLPKRQESEPSGIVKPQSNSQESLEKKKQLIGDMQPKSKSHLRDYMKKEQATGRKKGSSLTGTRSIVSASSASSGPQKRGRAAPDKRRGVPRQRSRSLTDIAPRDRRGSKKSTRSHPENKKPSAENTEAAEGFAEAAFSVFNAMAKTNASAGLTTQIVSVPEGDNEPATPDVPKLKSSRRGRGAPNDRGLARQRSSSLTNLRPRSKVPVLISTKDERDISRLKKKIVAQEEELKSIENVNIGFEMPGRGTAASKGLDAQVAYLTSYFESENDKERFQIRNLKEKIFDLKQENSKLKYGTEQTNKYYSELEAIDNAEVMKHEALLKNVPTFEGIVAAHEAKLERRIRKIDFERNTTQRYHDNMRSIIRMFQSKYDDAELVRTLEEIADLS